MSMLLTIEDVIKALEALKNIKRPDGDNEGDAINSNSVYPYLSDREKKLVEHAQMIVNTYVRTSRDEPNMNSLSEMNKAGYPAVLTPDEDDLPRLVGHVVVNDEWTLDMSDNRSQSIDD